MQEKLPIIVAPPRLGANTLGELLCGRESYVHVVLFHSLQASATTAAHLLRLITSYLMLGATLLENQCQTMGLAISGGSVPLSPRTPGLATSRPCGVVWPNWSLLKGESS